MTYSQLRFGEKKKMLHSVAVNCDQRSLKASAVKTLPCPAQLCNNKIMAFLCREQLEKKY